MEHFIFSCLESRLEEGGSLYGRFLLGPFQVGQGITVATALRRTLLSELHGVAITAIEIEGAAHQYSSIVGVQESTLDITLNLKQVVLAGAPATELPAVGYINVLGPKEVCASDLRLPSGISCVNGGHHIATVSSSGVLVIKFVISIGKNYVAHHSVPTQTAKPSLFKPTLRSSTAASPLPSSAVLGSRIKFVKRTKYAEVGWPPAKIDCRSRYRRWIASKLVRSSYLSSLSLTERGKISWAVNDMISYTKERRFMSARSDSLINRALGDSQILSEMEQNRVPLSSDYQIASPHLPGLANDPPAAQTGWQMMPSKRGVPRNWGIETPSPARVSKKAANGGPVSALAAAAQSTSYPLPLHQLVDSKVTRFNAIVKNSDLRPEAVREEVQGGRTISHESGVEAVLGDASCTLLPIDAVFMPVNKVNFSLQTDNQWQERRERIVLELWTNGSVSPRQALHEAATCLVYMFSLFRQSQTIQSVLPSFKALPTNENEHRLTTMAAAAREYQEIQVRRGSLLTPSWAGGFKGQKENGHSEGGLWDHRLGEGAQGDRRGNGGEEEGGAASGQRVRESSPFVRGHKGRVMDLGNLDLSVQAYVALKQARIHTIDDLLTCSADCLEKAMSDNKLISFEIAEKINQLKA